MLNFGFPFARGAVAIVATTVAFGALDSADAQMLKTVKDRGNLICGVSTGLPGFSNADDKGVNAFDVLNRLEMGMSSIYRYRDVHAQVKQMLADAQKPASTPPAPKP